MKTFQTKNFSSKKPIVDTATPVQFQMKSRPFVTNSTPQSQELTQTPEKAKLPGFNLAQIPIFPSLATPQQIQPKQAKEPLHQPPEINLPTSGGQPMPKPVRQKMENSFNKDLSHVRIHKGPEAENMGAIAGAWGSKNIIFQPTFQPYTQSGQKILGHEIAHLGQQEAGRVPTPQSQGVTINTDRHLEREADVLGAKAARGEPAQVKGAASSGVQRMAAQGNVVQCVREGKQPAVQPSDQQEDSDDEIFYDAEENLDAEANKFAEEVLNTTIDEAITHPEEVLKTDKEPNLFTDLAKKALEEQQYYGQSSTQEENLTSKEPEASDSADEIFYDAEDSLGDVNKPAEKASSSSQTLGGEESQSSSQEDELSRQIQDVAEVNNTAISQLELAQANLTRLGSGDVTEPDQLPQNIPLPETPQRRSAELRPEDIPLPETPQRRSEESRPESRRSEENQLEEIRQRRRADRIAALRGGLSEEELREDPPEQPSAIMTAIAKPFDYTKEPRSQISAAMRVYETGADQTQLLGRETAYPEWNQILGQNLKANDENINATNLTNLPPELEIPKKFGNDATLIGMTRDFVKSIGGLLVFSNNLKKIKDTYRDKKQSYWEKFGSFSGAAGEITSAITYTGIVGTQARAGGDHRRQVKNSTAASGAIVAAAQGGKIAGTALPFDAGKALASFLNTMPKLVTYVNSGVAAYQKDNFGGYKSIGRGIKNIADLTKSAAGAVKDISSLVEASGTATGALKGTAAANAEGAKLISGGAIAPLASSVVGGADTVQGLYKWNKARRNKQGLGEIQNQLRAQGVEMRQPNENEDNRADTLSKLQKIQDKKKTRAAIDAIVGLISLAAGPVGSSAGTSGLLSATVMGAAGGAIPLGQWGYREIKQYIRDKGYSLANPNKTTTRKDEDRNQLAQSTLTMLEGLDQGEHSINATDIIFSSIGLNGDKKDNAVQEVYNAVLDQYLARNTTNEADQLQLNELLRLKGKDQYLKAEVSWDQLNNNNDFPEDFVRLVKTAAIEKALKKR